MNIGVISDTHGLLRPEALDALRGSDHILHAGDIGDPEILSALKAIAPLTAVRGNNDDGAWAEGIAERELLALDGVRIRVLHDLKELEDASGCDVVVAGHSHKPLIEWRGEVLYLNPGSAGPRRFSLPVCVAQLVIADGSVDARIIELDVPPPKRKRKQ